MSISPLADLPLNSAGTYGTLRGNHHSQVSISSIESESSAAVAGRSMRHSGNSIPMSMGGRGQQTVELDSFLNASAWVSLKLRILIAF